MALSSRGGLSRYSHIVIMWLWLCREGPRVLAFANAYVMIFLNQKKPTRTLPCTLPWSGPSLRYSIGLDWVRYMGGFTSPMGLLDGSYWPAGPVVLPNLRVVVVVVRRQPYSSQSRSGRGTAQIRGKSLRQHCTKHALDKNTEGEDEGELPSRQR